MSFRDRTHNRRNVSSHCNCLFSVVTQTEKAAVWLGGHAAPDDLRNQMFIFHWDLIDCFTSRGSDGLSVNTFRTSHQYMLGCFFFAFCILHEKLVDGGRAGFIPTGMRAEVCSHIPCRCCYGSSCHSPTRRRVPLYAWKHLRSSTPSETVCMEYLAQLDHEYSSTVHFPHNAPVIKEEWALI